MAFDYFRDPPPEPRPEETIWDDWIRMACYVCDAHTGPRGLATVRWLCEGFLDAFPLMEPDYPVKGEDFHDGQVQAVRRLCQTNLEELDWADGKKPAAPPSPPLPPRK